MRTSKREVGGAKEYMGMEVRIKNGTSSECCIYINVGLHLGDPGGGRHYGEFPLLVVFFNARLSLPRR